MRRQVDLAVLLVLELVFPWIGDGTSAGVTVTGGQQRAAAVCRGQWGSSPLIQADVVLDEEEHLIGEVGGPEGSGQVDLF